MRRKTGFWLVILLSRAAAYGDGFYIGVRERPPSVPVQRAVVAFRDGVERLVVQSALDAEGQAFGWIMPLPARPIRFEVSTPGLMTMFETIAKPKITHDLTVRLQWVLVGVAACLVLTAAWISRRPLWMTIPLAIVTAWMFWTVLRVELALDKGRGGGRVPAIGVCVRDQVRIGSYDLVVLDAASPQDLNRWLGRNGFASVPTEGEGIVRDYIREGWVFVAAKLRRKGNGFSLPHPISMTFPCREPVYPMRLTALPGEPVRLTLFVLAEKAAKVYGLEQDYCDVFRKISPRSSFLQRSDSPGVKWPAFKSRLSVLPVGHPGVAKLLWDGCVLTKLSGKLTPAAMRRDLRIAFAKPLWFRRRVWSRRGAIQSALIMVLPCASMWLFALALLARRKLLQDRARLAVLKRDVGRVFVLSFLAIAAIYLALPRTEVIITLTEPPWQRVLNLYFIARQAKEELNGRPTSLEEVRRKMAKGMEWFSTPGRYSGIVPREEDSPGNYVVFADARGCVVRIFDRLGFPADIVVSPRSEGGNRGAPRDSPDAAASG